MKFPSPSRMPRHPELPTRERCQHDSVAIEAISFQLDDGGAIETVHAARAADPLQAMFARGTISRDDYAAGRRFQAVFHLAHLQPLQAVRLDRSGAGGLRRLPSGAAEDARELVATTMRIFGSPDSLAGSALWHVVGFGTPLKAWAQARLLHPTAASGVLLASLSILAAHDAAKQGA